MLVVKAKGNTAGNIWQHLVTTSGYIWQHLVTSSGHNLWLQLATYGNNIWSQHLVTTPGHNTWSQHLATSLPLILVVEGDLLAARDPALGEEADAQLAVDRPLLRLGHRVAAVVYEPGGKYEVAINYIN